MEKKLLRMFMMPNQKPLEIIPFFPHFFFLCMKKNPCFKKVIQNYIYLFLKILKFFIIKY